MADAQQCVSTLAPQPKRKSHPSQTEKVAFNLSYCCLFFALRAGAAAVVAFGILVTRVGSAALAAAALS